MRSHAGQRALSEPQAASEMTAMDYSHALELHGCVSEQLYYKIGPSSAADICGNRGWYMRKSNIEPG